MVPGAMAVEERIPEAMQKELIARGHKLPVAPPWSLASSAAIIIDAKTGVLSAGVDPPVEAYAWAWSDARHLSSCSLAAKRLPVHIAARMSRSRAAS
jgi:hypothetical protein